MKFFIALTLALSMICQFVFAQDEEVHELNQTLEENKPQTITKKLIVDFWGNFSSSDLNNLSDQETPDGNGAPSAQRGLNNGYLAFRYKLSADSSLGLIQNLGSGTGANTYASSGDTGLSIRNESLFSTEHLKVIGELSFFAPTSAASQAATLQGSERGMAILIYGVPNSRLHFGLYNLLQTNQYTDTSKEQETNSDDIFFYQAPFANYNFTEKLAATLWVDLLQTHERFDLAGVHTDPALVKPGLSYSLNADLNLNPYLSLAPGGVSLSSSYFGIFVSLRL